MIQIAKTCFHLASLLRDRILFFSFRYLSSICIVVQYEANKMEMLQVQLNEVWLNAVYQYYPSWFEKKQSLSKFI